MEPTKMPPIQCQHTSFFSDCKFEHGFIWYFLIGSACFEAGQNIVPKFAEPHDDLSVKVFVSVKPRHVQKVSFSRI